MASFKPLAWYLQHTNCVYILEWLIWNRFSLKWQVDDFEVMVSNAWKWMPNLVVLATGLKGSFWIWLIRWGDWYMICCIRYFTFFYFLALLFISINQIVLRWKIASDLSRRQTPSWHGDTYVCWTRFPSPKQLLTHARTKILSLIMYQHCHMRPRG